jgi:isopentenyl-diphosphate delta-isomerase
VDLSTTFLGHRLQAPFLIAGMTGGHEGALDVNRNLAQAAARLGRAIGTGSQRAALADPRLTPTYSVVRDQARDSLVIGNLGMSQMVSQGRVPPFGPADFAAAVDMIGADAMAIHLNAVEELVQTEGDREMKGIASAIAACVEWSPVPLIAKETGAGMTRESALALAATGVRGLDVGGIGGTSFARIEALRAREAGDERGVRVGATFADWGLPTAISILEASGAGLPLIATGGVRNGLHAAKAIALGATLVGIGSPAINAALISDDAVIQELSLMIEELRVAMTLIGVADIESLHRHRPVVMGRVAEWQRGREGNAVHS